MEYPSNRSGTPHYVHFSKSSVKVPNVSTHANTHTHSTHAHTHTHSPAHVHTCYTYRGALDGRVYTNTHMYTQTHTCVRVGTCTWTQVYPQGPTEVHVPDHTNSSSTVPLQREEWHWAGVDLPSPPLPCTLDGQLALRHPRRRPVRPRST